MLAATLCLPLCPRQWQGAGGWGLAADRWMTSIKGEGTEGEEAQEKGLKGGTRVPSHSVPPPLSLSLGTAPFPAHDALWGPGVPWAGSQAGAYLGLAAARVPDDKHRVPDL